MFRRRDEEEITTTSAVTGAENIQPLSPQKNVTGLSGVPAKKDSQNNTPSPAKSETTAEPLQNQSQNQPQTQDKTMSATSFTDVTPKQTTYKLTPSGAFTNQDQPAATPPATKPTFSVGTNQTPRFDNIEAERRLTVGYGISLEGKVSDCDKLIIYGSVKAELNNVKTLHISESGKFTGSATIEHAEISGVFEGEIKVSKNIVINSTGRVSGKITYGSIEIKPGGKFTGEILEDKSLLENNTTTAFSGDSAWQKEETELASSEDKAA